MQPLWLPKELFAKESTIINSAFAHVTFFFWVYKFEYLVVPPI